MAFIYHLAVPDLEQTKIRSKWAQPSVLWTVCTSGPEGFSPGPAKWHLMPPQKESVGLSKMGSASL